MEMEWRQIEGFDNRYFVSSNGDINVPFRIDTIGHKRAEHILLPSEDRCGYLFVRLFSNKKYYNLFVHRLVAIAFIPNPNNYNQINHIDGNKQNNNKINLEWCTNGQNFQHAICTGLIKRKGEDSPMAKFTEKEVLEIRKLFSNIPLIEDVAKKYKVTTATIYNILRRRTWKHI